MISELTLMVKYKKLLQSGISYEEILNMLDYDKKILTRNLMAIINMEENQMDSPELYELASNQTVMNSLDEYPIHKSALDFAKDVFYKEVEINEQESLYLALKNTNLD